MPQMSYEEGNGFVPLVALEEAHKAFQSETLNANITLFF